VIDPKDAILTCCSFSANNTVLATGRLFRRAIICALPKPIVRGENNNAVANGTINVSGSLDKALFLWNLPLDDDDATAIRKSVTYQSSGKYDTYRATPAVERAKRFVDVTYIPTFFLQASLDKHRTRSSVGMSGEFLRYLRNSSLRFRLRCDRRARAFCFFCWAKFWFRKKVRT